MTRSLIAHSGAEAINQVALAGPDLVILDLGLPDLDGLEVCRRIREFSDVPIVVLSAYGDERRKVEALDSGADDFVTKPFGMAELEARLRVALRHAAARSDGSEKSTTLEVGDLDVDLVHHMATLSGEPLQLTAKEFELLAYLARHAGKVCTHHMILKDVWGPGYGAESNYVRVYTHRLRKKLGDEEGRMLRTVPGIGYQLVPDAHSGNGRTNRAGCASASTPRSSAGVPSATTRDPEAIPGTPTPAEEAQDQRAGPVDQDGVGADPGPLVGDDRLNVAGYPRPLPWHQRRDGGGGAPHVLSLARASLSCSTLM